MGIIEISSKQAERLINAHCCPEIRAACTDVRYIEVKNKFVEVIQFVIPEKQELMLTHLGSKIMRIGNKIILKYYAADKRDIPAM